MPTENTNYKKLYEVFFKVEYPASKYPRNYYKDREVFDNKEDAINYYNELVKRGYTVYPITSFYYDSADYID